MATPGAGKSEWELKYEQMKKERMEKEKPRGKGINYNNTEDTHTTADITMANICAPNHKNVEIGRQKRER